MKNKTCLITGANAGIGKQAAIQLAAEGFHVIMAARSQERGAKALEEVKAGSGSGSVELMLMDMASQKSIRDACKDLHSNLESLDVLIHNAADFDIARKKPEKSPEGIETIWATNHIGPVLLTDLLLDLLNKSTQGRVITIASQGLTMYPRLKVELNDAEFEARKFSVSKAYYQSKLAQLMYTYYLADQLKDTAITVNCIRVTNVKIDISRYPEVSAIMKKMYSLKSRFAISASDMAKTYSYVATSPDLDKSTGKYFSEKNAVVDSSPYSKDSEQIEAVMKLTLKYLLTTGNG